MCSTANVHLVDADGEPARPASDIDNRGGPRQTDDLGGPKEVQPTATAGRTATHGTVGGTGRAENYGFGMSVDALGLSARCTHRDLYEIRTTECASAHGGGSSLSIRFRITCLGTGRAIRYTRPRPRTVVREEVDPPRPCLSRGIRGVERKVSASAEILPTPFTRHLNHWRTIRNADVK